MIRRPFRPGAFPDRRLPGLRPEDLLPDVRDGLSRVERVILYELYRLEQERPGRNVASALLYGRVVEHIDISPEAMQAVLARLGARKTPKGG